MHRRVFISAALVPLVASTSNAFEKENQTWKLITAEEFARENSREHIEQVVPAELAGPTIIVERPDENKKVKSPVSVQIAFRAHADARIDKSSLKVTYGFFDFDITKRIVEHANMTDAGLSAENAEIPAGQHKVTIEISEILLSDNSTRRIGRRAISFTVI